MAAVSDKELVKAIKAGEFSSVYYFYGKDTANVSAYAKRLAEKLVRAEDETYNLHRFEGKTFDLGRFSDAAEAFPLGAERVCILVNDLNADALGEEDLKFLIEILGALPPTTTVIFFATGISPEAAGKKTLTAKNKKLIDAIAKKGSVCEFSYKKPAELAKWIEGRAKALGSAISSANAQYLAFLCLSDTLLIENEIAKLCSYAGGEITAEAIDLLVTKQLDSNAFALAKAVVSFNSKQAISLLDELFSQRAEPVAILAALSMSFSDLYRAKLAQNEGISSAQVLEDFGYRPNRKFAVDNAFRDVRKISIEKLRLCMKIMAETDGKLKSSRGDGRLLLEKAVVQCSTVQ